VTRPPPFRAAWRSGAVAILLIGLSISSAQAQSSGTTPPTSRPPDSGAAQAPIQQQTDAPPYEPELLRLSEMLGALHHLRAICASQDAPKWRDSMVRLMQTEATTPGRRARLAGAFNAGFQAYRRSYQSCTPAAELVIRRFLAEGAKIARDVAARYGN
jgi:uncharacterized protein (TIGR02301 family)